MGGINGAITNYNWVWEMGRRETSALKIAFSYNYYCINKFNFDARLDVGVMIRTKKFFFSESTNPDQSIPYSQSYTEYFPTLLISLPIQYTLTKRLSLELRPAILPNPKLQALLMTNLQIVWFFDKPVISSN
jgi:hypothetical protein